MTALFFVTPGRADSADIGSLRRIDFAHLARMFAEPEPAVLPPVRERRQAMRLAAAALLLLGALGDTMLVARPAALASSAGRPAPSGFQQT